MSWLTVKLGDVCEIVSGSTPKTGQKEYWDGDIFWATPKDLSGLKEKLIEKTERQITAEGLSSCAAKVLPKNSVLFSSRAPIGLVAVNDVPMATNQGFKSFVPKQNILSPHYLYWWLKTNRTYLNSLGVGATFKEVSKSIVERVQIPLPPLAEQQRIAAILDKAEEIKRKREQAIAKLDELAQSTFVEMFGEAKWRKVAIAEVTKQVQNCAPQSKFFGEFTYVDIGAVDNVSKKIINPQLLNKDDAPSRARQLIEKDDVLVSTVRPNLNAVAQVESEYLNAVASTGFCVLRCKQESVLPEYIFAIVKSRKFVKEMVRLATGASYPAVNDKIISQYLISLPPIELQRAFSEKIKTLRDYASKIVKHDDKLIRLTASLQNQAFTTGFDA